MMTDEELRALVHDLNQLKRMVEMQASRITAVVDALLTNNWTGDSQGTGGSPHEILTFGQRAALRRLIPEPDGPTPEKAGDLVDGSGIGDAPPRYSDTRPGELINLDKPLFGYQDSDSQRGFCGGCAEPPSEHACPEVKDG